MKERAAQPADPPPTPHRLEAVEPIAITGISRPPIQPQKKVSEPAPAPAAAPAAAVATRSLEERIFAGRAMTAQAATTRPETYRLR